MARSPQAEELLGVRLVRLVGDLFAGRELLRSHDREAIHSTRVATRRLRSVLRTFELCFDDRALAPVMGELTWLGCELGRARDAEVLRESIRGAAIGLPAIGELGARLALMVDETGHDARIAADRVERVLSGARFEHVAAELRALADDPPIARPGRARVDALRSAVDRRIARTDRLARRAARLEGEEHEVALHEVRKAAKHVRYGAEVLAPLAPDRARRCVRAFAQVQAVLGSYHDALVARDFALGHLKRSVEDSHAAFVCGVLYRYELDEAASFEAAFAPAWRDARRRGARAIAR